MVMMVADDEQIGGRIYTRKRKRRKVVELAAV
jgi:hypothetical protein